MIPASALAQLNIGSIVNNAIYLTLPVGPGDHLIGKGTRDTRVVDYGEAYVLRVKY